MQLKLNKFLIVVFSILAFTACTKEYSDENGVFGNAGSSSGTAIFTLGGAPGNCTGAIVNSTYTAGSLLADSNTVVISVNVDSVGTYAITTGTVNGISFNASGTFTKKGTQNVTLRGSGTPIASGSFTFNPGTNSCDFLVTIVANPSAPPVTTDCKACSYVPICAGSRYTYVDSTPGLGSQLRNSDFLAVSDTTIDGAPYSKVTLSTGNAYYNCNNGTTTAIAYNITSVSGSTTLSELKQIVLEAAMPVGSTWTSSIQNGAGQTDNYLYKIAEVGISRTVLSATYTNVIHVNTTVSVNGINVNSADYYYAKGVGLIESDLSDYNTGTLYTTELLKSYFIP